MKLILDTAKMPVQAFSYLAGPVIINHAGTIERNQDFVAKGLVYLPVSDMGRVNRPHFPTLAQSKMAAFFRLPFSVQHFPPTPSGAGEQVQLEVLGTLLPANTITALLAVHEHFPITKYLVD